MDGATWVALTTVARDTDANTLTALVPHQSLFAILTSAAGAPTAPVAATDVDVAPHRKVDVYRPPAFVAVSFRLPAPYDVADIAGPVGVDGVVDAISVSSADGVATVVFDGQALLDLEAANVTTRSHVLRGVLRARPGDLTPPAFDRVPFEAAFSFEVASSLSTSTIHFHGNKPRAKFEGDMLLTIGELPEDFRSGATAGHGSLRLTLGDGSVLAYDNPDVGFTLSGVTNPRRDEKWQFKGPASKEEMTIRWDSAPTYDATNDPGLPRSVGSLRSEFIATDETSLTIDFRKATLPLTVVVDGVVLATIRTDRSVVTALPAEIRRTTATVLFPARLVPGVVIAWYRDGDTSDGVQDLVYTQECAADGTRSATYNNGTARYSVSVPIPSDIDAGDLAANAVLSFTIGEPGVTAVSEANIDVAYRVDNDHGDIDWLYRPAYQWGGILDWLDWLLNLLAPDLHDHGNCHGSH